jgi:hypothetical protein
MSVVRLILLIDGLFGMAFGTSSWAAPTAPQQRQLVAGILGIEPHGQCIALDTVYLGGWVFLGDYGPFVAGDTVTVSFSQTTLGSCGGSYYDLLPDNTIAAWRHFDFGCGTLYVEPEYGCGIMTSPVYDTMLLLGSTGFHTGDNIHLYGDLDLLYPCGAIPECAATYCVDAPSTGLCALPTQTRTWGRIKAMYR